MDFLILLYPWTKAFHVISVIAWMAGLFYLPRLFVYHAEKVGQYGETHELFQTMELKLLRVIMNPAMVSTWVFGIALALTPGVIDWSSVWPWSKLLGVIGMTWFHVWCGWRRRDFAVWSGIKEGRHYRLMNEVPTVLLVIIVVSVVVKPI